MNIQSNYKIVECYFYKQNRCLKGDNCTFRHGTDDLKSLPPPSPPKRFMRPIPHWNANITQKVQNEIDLCKLLKIETWETYPRQFHYKIMGSIDDCKKYFYEYIIQDYPENPYFTRITHEGGDFIEVSRSTTCS